MIFIRIRRTKALCSMQQIDAKSIQSERKEMLVNERERYTLLRGYAVRTHYIQKMKSTESETHSQLLRGSSIICHQTAD